MEKPAAQDDDRPAIVVDDIVKLARWLAERVIGTVKALTTFTGWTVINVVPVPADAASESSAADRGEQAWNPAMVRLINWFNDRRADLPLERYELEPGVVIAEPDTFYFAISEAISAGPNGLHAVLGDLHEDLERLYGRFGATTPVMPVESVASAAVRQQDSLC
jgi:hypothetical protein